MESSCRPLHESADIMGPARWLFLAPPKLFSGPHDPSQVSTRTAVRRIAIPRCKSALIPLTHNRQCALPGVTKLAAAIHCASVNPIPEGGLTPFSIAHASRSSGVWQQHRRQHSPADAQPHGQFSHG